MQEVAAEEHLRTQFLRRVAHDIASPVGVVLTVLEEIERADHGRPDLVPMARRSLRRLTRLSEHLALVAELEAGPLDLELAAVDAGAIVEQAFSDARAVDARREVSASCDVPLAPLRVRVDPRLVVFTIREVIGNALRLAASRVTVSVAAEDGAAVVRVDDDGPGFSAEALETLGRRFVATPAPRGLGLSLSMAVEILAAHGGGLRVSESALPPKRQTPGAAVLVTLPAYETSVGSPFGVDAGPSPAAP